jgi:long-chain acyl-CoA synthetase
LSTAPLYHAAPLRFALAVIAAGGFVHALEKFEPEAALVALSTRGITHSQWVPTMFQRLLRLPHDERLKFKAPAHRVALHAAAPCPEPVKRAMIDWWGQIVLEYYSGTEGVGLTMIDSSQWLAHPGSVGQAVKGVPHVIDDAGRELPAGEVGQIYFSGVPPFKYFGDSKKTAARTTPDGWQTFGDIGHLDASGYLFITDRMDDMIISGGVNVYPQEIEAAILELTDVLDCGVVGVNDDEFGERPVAFVVGSTAMDPQALLEQVRQHCEGRLGRIKRPDHCIVVDAIPRSATGKLLRRDLRARFASTMKA